MEKTISSHPLDRKIKDAVKQGFSTVIVVIIIVVVIAVGFLILKQIPKSQVKNLQTASNPSPQSALNPDEPPLKLKSIGINISEYDPKTGKAGDFVFTKEKLQFGRLFMGFGFVIPAEVSSGGKAKSNPQPTFVVPIGTPIRSLVDGIVAAIPTLWSKDYSIQVTTNGKMQKWVYEVEHVVNPKVKVGEKVTAGQIVGEVSNFNNGAPIGFGEVEIGILKGGQTPEHVCPFAYLDESIRDDTWNKMNSLFDSWENYSGDNTLYNKTAIPGCLTQDPIED